MSYIQIDIGGKKRGLKFNQGALILFQENIDSENIKATSGYALIYAGLKSNCYVKREEADFTFENVCDWVDELKEDTISLVLAAFQETQVYKDLIPNLPDEPKKKLPGKSIKRNVMK